MILSKSNFERTSCAFAENPGPFKPHEYGLVILPMTVVKRFHDCLLPTHDNVLAQYEKVKHLAVIDGFLTRASGYQFYNTSKFTFETLLADPDNIETNFKDYLAGFSANAQDVLSKFDFDNIINIAVQIMDSFFHTGKHLRCSHRHIINCHSACV